MVSEPLAQLTGVYCAVIAAALYVMLVALAVDEAPERLGEHLQLPAFLEERRAELAAILPPLA